MPRIPRNHISTNYFHVMVQGINKSYIFNEAQDINYYINTMYLLNKEYNIIINAYCIMNNHAHILLNVNNVELMSKFMQRLNIKYSRYFNNKYNRVGHVFRNRYSVEGIYSELQLYNCMKYIYNNPVKANMCNSAKDYPYSNYKEIPQNFVESDYIFIDVDKNDEIICKSVIDIFLKKHNLKITELKNDKQKLQLLITILKKQHNISLRKISEGTKINREYIRRIYKNSS